ncbi:hypothetical protein Q73_13585 [Bacillus coahuilensis m2-6]|uniref:hypothetical protein n=1 Tax=Bacillus coahuilensis TaxID=408580 RepID=UPI00075063F3|nr:hypothetical protein [Bacillus coahuilensis]KUP05109.1 hypothetical protein Q73_13585 [Bacillus coahuilensis m2-6]
MRVKFGWMRIGMVSSVVALAGCSGGESNGITTTNPALTESVELVADLTETEKVAASQTSVDVRNPVQVVDTLAEEMKNARSLELYTTDQDQVEGVWISQSGLDEDESHMEVRVHHPLLHATIVEDRDRTLLKEEKASYTEGTDMNVEGSSYYGNVEDRNPYKLALRYDNPWLHKYSIFSHSAGKEVIEKELSQGNEPIPFEFNELDMDRMVSYEGDELSLDGVTLGNVYEDGEAMESLEYTYESERGTLRVVMSEGDYTRIPGDKYDEKEVVVGDDYEGVAFRKSISADADGAKVLHVKKDGYSYTVILDEPFSTLELEEFIARAEQHLF